jgi:hypothetical protein
MKQKGRKDQKETKEGRIGGRKIERMEESKG